MPDDIRAATPALGSIVNFRDFGGAPTTDGRRVIRGRLFRSGHHSEATDADLAALAGLPLGLIVDLRRPAERERMPSRRPAGWAATVIEHEGPGDAVAPHLAGLMGPDLTADIYTRQMKVGYRGYPYDDPFVSIYRRYFDALGTVDGAVVIHCHAGKDRTGMLCALTLHALGVHEAQILDDFLLTNAHSQIEERLPQVAANILRDTGHAVPEDLLRHILGVQPDYLEAAYDEIRQRSGSMDGYLETVVGLTPERRRALQDRYLEG